MFRAVVRPDTPISPRARHHPDERRWQRRQAADRGLYRWQAVDELLPAVTEFGVGHAEHWDYLRDN